MNAVPPGGTIGILGGGQLGRMLALAAARLGLKTHIYSPETDAPAFQVSSAHTNAPFDDKAALENFAAACDVVTFEFENVPVRSIDIIAASKPVFPSAATLAVTQDRFEEKSFVASLGLKTAPFRKVDGEDVSVTAPSILKTRRFGYDGKGQAKVAGTADLARTFESFKRAPCILEGFVDFEFEASVIAGRGIDGAFAAYDPPENIHRDHILRRSIVPSRLTGAQAAEAKAMAKKIADALGYVGVLAVELFVTRDALLVNEIAPRVHNSGHWTIEACVTSQFEQHIRAVAGWPLGDPARHSDAVMDNLIGAEADDWRALAAGGGGLHLYGKSESRPGRKMGHVTTLKPKIAGR
jgi:5-(carboxyamino)imidazole ribonucleotide synthase